MGARTCLLCGKPLSRIWSGTGEDFCSREHRNQYRLRQGMDRLVEASKVASVMRRRENPRQIPTASLRSTGPALQRGFESPQPVREWPIAPFTPSQTRPVLQSRLQASSRFRTPRGNRGQDCPGEIRAPQAMPFPGQRMATPPITAGMAAHLGQAPASQLSHIVANAPSTPLVSLSAWRGGSQPIVTVMRKRGARPAIAALGSAPPVRRVAIACEGRALRVSLPGTFRIPPTRLPSGHLGGPEIVGMVWPGIRPLAIRGEAGEVSPNVSQAAIAPPPLCIPAPPAADFERRFVWPGAFVTRIEFVNTANGKRTAFVPFGAPDDSRKKEDEHYGS